MPKTNQQLPARTTILQVLAKPPVPDAAGFDPAVTGFQVSFPGTMDAASGGNTPSFDLLFQLRVQ
ncbi:MAG: hypothetical protein V3T36_00040 [Gammaproteobacteria bacterium]